MLCMQTFKCILPTYIIVSLDTVLTSSRGNLVVHCPSYYGSMKMWRIRRLESESEPLPTPSISQALTTSFMLHLSNNRKAEF